MNMKNMQKLIQSDTSFTIIRMLWDLTSPQTIIEGHFHDFLVCVCASI